MKISDLPKHVQEAIERGEQIAAASNGAISPALERFRQVQKLEVPIAKGISVEPGMNKLETRYAEYLDRLKLGHRILWWRFNAFRFRLADGAWYKPDFAVMLASYELECHETKGFWREAARVRIKVAADLYPIRFVAVTEDENGWHFEKFGAA